MESRARARGHIEFGPTPTHTGPEHRRAAAPASGTDMKRMAAARATGCYQNPHQAPLSTPAVVRGIPAGAVGYQIDPEGQEPARRMLWE
jgi:hypothetical protein